MNMFNILLQHRANWLYDVPRFVFAWIDRGIYWLIARLYDLIVDLAYIKVLDNELLGQFYTRVYGLLSIVMLFKVTFSVISYILDPSKMSDKQQGFGKIITNILLMFAMLISCPTAFSLLYDAQEAILSDNIIPNFIFGGDGVSANNNSYAVYVATPSVCNKWLDYSTIKHSTIDFNDDGRLRPWTTPKAGEYISLMIFRTFYSLGDPNVAIDDGRTLKIGDMPTVGAFCAGTYDMENILESEEMEYIAVSDASVIRLVSYVNEYHSDSQKKNEYYYIDYKFFLSTVMGAFVAVLFLSIAFDVAVRSVQLSFLQLIAPIPIISFIDPASGKSGTFSKWIKNVGKTWVSLFIRLFSIFFAVFVICEVDENMIKNSFDGTGRKPESVEWIIMLFIIIGVLMFAKKLPDLIEELIPGLKMGKMELNPLKKIEQEAIGGKEIAGVVRGAGGAARGLIGGSIAGCKAGSEAGNVGKGLVLGAAQGMIKGFKTPKGAFTNNLNTTYKDLTGNEMVRLTPLTLFAQAGGKKAMDEVKGVLKNMNTEKRNLTQKLSVQEHITATTASNLQANGVDLENLDNERVRLNSLTRNQRTQRTTFNSRRDAYQNDMARLESQRDVAQTDMTRLESQRDAAQTNMTRLESLRDSEQANKTRLENERNSEQANITRLESQRNSEQVNMVRLESLRDSEQAKYNDAILEKQKAQEYIDNRKPIYDANGNSMYNDKNEKYIKAKEILAEFEAKEVEFKEKITQYDADIAASRKNIERYDDHIATSRINIEKYDVDIATADANIDKYTVDMEPIRTNIDQYNADITPIRETIEQYDADIATIRTNIAQYDSAIASLDNDISKNEGLIKNIDDHNTSYKETIETRKELAKMEKNIAKMQDEKSQRAKFYNQGDSKSTREEISELIEEFGDNENN